MAFRIDTTDTSTPTAEVRVNERVHPLVTLHRNSKAWKISSSRIFSQGKEHNDFMCEGLYDGKHSSITLKEMRVDVMTKVTTDDLINKYNNNNNNNDDDDDDNPDAEVTKSLENTNIEEILRIATPSKFGKGSETVYDETIRKGLEILPQQVHIRLFQEQQIKNNLSQNLFKTGLVSLQFSKMAIYQVGGHFDIHRDHNQHPDHQGTLLLEVRSEHTGGDLVLSHHGMEYRWSLADSPPTATVSFDYYGDNIVKPLRYIAFFTDVIHRVEPVTSGVRIVLQYDILITPTAPGRLRNTDSRWDLQNTTYFPSPITDVLASDL